MKIRNLAIVGLLVLGCQLSFGQSSASSQKMYVTWKPAIPKPNGPVNLEITDIVFTDHNGNNKIDAQERFSLQFTIVNNGPGTAYQVMPNLDFGVYGQYIKVNSLSAIAVMGAGEKVKMNVICQGSATLPDGNIELTLSAIDGNHFASSGQGVNIEGFAFRPPKVMLKEFVFASQDGGIPQPNAFITLKMIIKNEGESTAEDVKVKFDLPSNVYSSENPGQESIRSIGNLLPSEEKLVEFRFFANSQYSSSKIEIGTSLFESYGKYAINPISMPTVDISKSIVKNSTTTITARNDEVVHSTTTLSLISDVNKDIPVVDISSPNIFALVIGNERYASNNDEIDVPYANSDASTFAEYLQKTIGVAISNTVVLKDATKATIEREVNLLCKRAKTYPDTVNRAQIILYYAGHGYADQLTKDGYIIPVDVSTKDIRQAIRTADIYDMLAKAEVGKATVFLDACFSGGSRLGSIVEGRAIRVEANKDVVNGNVIIFSATRNDQIALAYNAEKHGMFTYFLLKKLQQTKGATSYDELNKYLQQQVNHTSLVVNNTEQTPDIIISPAVGEKWREWTLSK